MLYTDFTEKLLGLQDVNITNVEESEKEIIIYAELKRKKHNCICCGTLNLTEQFVRSAQLHGERFVHPQIKNLAKSKNPKQGFTYLFAGTTAKSQPRA